MQKEVKLMLGDKELNVGDRLTEEDGFPDGKIRYIDRYWLFAEVINDDESFVWTLSEEEGNLGKLEWK